MEEEYSMGCEGFGRRALRVCEAHCDEGNSAFDDKIRVDKNYQNHYE